MKHFGGLRFLLQCNYEDKYFKTIPIFYRNMLKYFSYIFKSEPASDIIWNNKDIKINGKPFYLHKWNEKGITTRSPRRKWPVVANRSIQNKL